MQEASATVLTAALTSNDSSIDKGSSSTDKHVESIDSRPSSTSEKIDESKSSECRVEVNSNCSWLNIYIYIYSLSCHLN